MTKQEINKLIEERTYFDDIVNIKTGQIKEEYNPETCVRVSFNDKKLTQMRKIVPALLRTRGILNPEEIDESTPAVRSIIKKRTAQRKSELKGRAARYYKMDKSEINSIVNTLNGIHTPHYTAAIAQGIYYVAFVDDLFESKRGEIICRFDVEVQEDFWQALNDELTGNDITDMVLDHIYSDFPKPRYDTNSPLEQMISVIMVFLEENANLSHTFNEYYLPRIMANITINGGASDEELDEFQAVSSLLDELLPVSVPTRDNSKRDNVGGSDQSHGNEIVVKKTTKSKTKRVEKPSDTTESEEGTKD